MKRGDNRVIAPFLCLKTTKKKPFQKERLSMISETKFLIRNRKQHLKRMKVKQK